MSTWGKAARATLVVVAVLGAAWGLLRWSGWLDIDLGDLEPTSEDLARTEALAADPVMGLTPAGWAARFDRMSVAPSLVDFGDRSNEVARSFDVGGSSGNIAADLLVVADVVAQLGWGEFLSYCGSVDNGPAASASFTAIKVIRGLEARVAVRINESLGDDSTYGRIEIITPSESRDGSAYSEGRVADMSCLEAAAQETG